MPSMSLPTSIRPATPDDAQALVEIIDMASEGLSSYLWAQMAEPGESVREFGERRARRDDGGFSYRNAQIAEVEDTPAGGLIGYPLPDEPAEIGPDLPAMFVPFQELENLACGSWYINVLAVYPRYRGRGLGRRLLDAAEKVATEGGRQSLSVMVFDRNLGARRLYERVGYREIARRPIVKEDWACESSETVLLMKELVAP